jgi:hypothetical protein
MKNELIRLLDELGIVFKYLVNGLIGGIIWSIYRKTKFLEALRQIFIGGVVSGYFTPVIVKQGLPDEAVGFTSFVIGMMGMVIIDAIYKYVRSRLAKWKDAFVDLIKKLFL